MDDKESNSDSKCELGRDALTKEAEETLTSIGAKSNTDDHDKYDLGSNSPDDNSIMTFTTASASSQTIKVYLRLRPFPLEIHLTREQENAYTIVNSTTLLTKLPGLNAITRSLKNIKVNERVCRTFTFTTAFGPATLQKEFFDKAIEPQIQSFLAGHSSTVMSYGTSNAGKSYTLYGDPLALGIIPLSINFIFQKVNSTLSTPWYKPVYQSHVVSLSSTDRIRELEIKDKLLSFSLPEKMEYVNAYQTMRDTLREKEVDIAPPQDEHVIYSVWISFAEIYNDAIYDLLSSDWNKQRLPLKMVTDKQGRTFIKGLRTVNVNSDEEAYQILLAGQYTSKIASTTLNSRSSRSHCIFTIQLLKYCAESTPENVEVSALSFCDLAGSGRLKMTTNLRDRIKETQNINTSLLVLGRCLKSIWEGQSTRQKSDVVGPFRESKLTRLLQKALSGKEQITLIVNVNPVPSLYAETHNVLNFSAIAKKIIVEPIKGVKTKTFTSRFSRVVSQSVKTITDWDHAAADDSAHERFIEKVKTSDYSPRECYDDLSVKYKKLKEEYAALKTSMVDKDLEIREEMANTFTGLINNLEADWRSRSKDVEEQQEHLLAWSVCQVENFYKEKLNRLDSRKRRRWDDGDAFHDREADIRVMEAENAGLTAKILVAKETIKEHRSSREKAIAEKNKTVFELSLVKEEIKGIKKMLEAAENDIRFDEEGAHFMHELKTQLSSKEERIKSLKEFLNEAKEEYIRITSDAGRMQEELKEANETLIENAEVIEDLEEQLDQSNSFLAKRTKEIEQLTEKLEHRSNQLAEFKERAKSAEEELKKSESIRLNLIGAVEDLNKLHEIACTRELTNSNDCQYSLIDSKITTDREKNYSKFKNPEMMSEITNVESENSPTRQEIRARNRFENIANREISLGRLKDESTIDIDESLHKENHSFKLSGSGEINDSGIVVTMGSENQTIEEIDITVDTNSETEKKNSLRSFTATYDNNSSAQELGNLQFQYGEPTDCGIHDIIWVRRLFQELEIVKQEIVNLNQGYMSHEVQATRYRNNLESIEIEMRSANVNELERVSRFTDMVSHMETKIDDYKAKIDTFQKDLIARMDKKIFDCECSNAEMTKLGKQLSKIISQHLQIETETTRCLSEHEGKIVTLVKEVSELKEKDNFELQPTRERVSDISEKDTHTLSELRQGVKEFLMTLAKSKTFLEWQIKNWPLRELANTRAASILYKKLENECMTNKAEFGEEMFNISSDLQRSEDMENTDKLFKKLNNTDSNKEIYEDIEKYYAFKRENDDEKLTNHITMHRFKSEDDFWSDEVSSPAIELVAAPTSTPRSLDSHFHEKPMLAASLRNISASLSNSAASIEKKSLSTRKEVFEQATKESEPLEVHDTLRAREIMLIIFLIIVYLVQYVR